MNNCTVCGEVHTSRDSRLAEPYCPDSPQGKLHTRLALIELRLDDLEQENESRYSVEEVKDDE